jgi:uncharacterized protein YjbJ (UPF0337 family)
MNERDRDLGEKGIDNSLRGKAKDLKGRVKDAAGGLTGDSELQAEGKWDRVKGNVQEKVGEAQQDLDDLDERNRNSSI